LAAGIYRTHWRHFHFSQLTIMNVVGLKEHISRMILLHSTGALVDFHTRIRDGLAQENALPPNAPRKYGFREHADFRWEADAIEAELETRNVLFQPIVW
jgi:hypothetical protein